MLVLLSNTNIDKNLICMVAPGLQAFTHGMRGSLLFASPACLWLKSVSRWQYWISPAVDVFARIFFNRHTMLKGGFATLIGNYARPENQPLHFYIRTFWISALSFSSIALVSILSASNADIIFISITGPKYRCCHFWNLTLAFIAAMEFDAHHQSPFFSLNAPKSMCSWKESTFGIINKMRWYLNLWDILYLWYILCHWTISITCVGFSIFSASLPLISITWHDRAELSKGFS